MEILYITANLAKYISDEHKRTNEPFDITVTTHTCNNFSIINHSHYIEILGCNLKTEFTISMSHISVKYFISTSHAQTTLICENYYGNVKHSGSDGSVTHEFKELAKSFITAGKAVLADVIKNTC